MSTCTATANPAIEFGSCAVEDIEKVNIRIPECSKATPRVNKLREKFLTAHRTCDIERCRSYYNFYYKGNKMEDRSMVTHAEFFRKYLSERTIYIEDGQLIAGSFGRVQRAMVTFPEVIGKEMMREYRRLPYRQVDKFDISDAELEELDKMMNDMDITSLRKQVFASLSEDELNLFLKDPKNDPITMTNVFGIDLAVDGPGGHINPDYQTVLEQGLETLKRKAQHRMRLCVSEKDEKGVDFLNAMIICIDAMGEFALRYSELAKSKAEAESDPVRKAELLRMADACAHVPMKPARSFYEACQSLWFLFVGIQLEHHEKCFSVGRFDQFAWPFLKADLENGVLTEDEAQEILDCLFLKFPETNYIVVESNKTGVGFPVQQQFVVGGVTPEGKEASNPLSYMVIQGGMDIRLNQPVVSLRMADETPDALYRKACELARLGTGHPSFFCDNTIIKSLVHKGVLIEDARDYSIVGCSSVQLTRKDRGGHNAGYMNLASCLEFALRDGYWPKGDRQLSIHTGDPKEFKSYDEVVAAFQKHVEHLISIYTKACLKAEEVQRDQCPTPFLSCMVQDCITRAKDRNDGGAVYNFGPTSRAVGFATTVDSLAIIKKLVFEDKIVDMSTLIEAMDADYEGFDWLRNEIAKVPKYGNDDDYVDSIGYEITKIYAEAQNQHRALHGDSYHPGFSSVSANVSYGTAVATLPDGRHAYTPLSDGVSPNHHVEKNGPTAVVKSSTKLYYEGLSGGAILNLRFAPQSVKDEEGLENLTAFVKGMQKAGIWHAQFNMNDGEMLMDAQAHPENYPDLLVRVAGYSAFFLGLTPQLQSDIIDRTVYNF